MLQRFLSHALFQIVDLGDKYSFSEIKQDCIGGYESTFSLDLGQTRSPLGHLLDTAIRCLRQKGWE